MGCCHNKLIIALEKGVDRGWKNIEGYNRKILDCLEQTLRNIDIKDATGGGLGGKENTLLGNGRMETFVT